MPSPRPITQRLPATDRRNQLLETALDLFSQKGFEGTTTKAIAEAAGVTEAIIFRHFPSKHELYKAVLGYRHNTSCLHDWMEEAKALMDRNDVAGLMRAIVTAVIDDHKRDARLERVLLFAALEGHEEALAHHRQLSLEPYELLKQYLARRQREGKLRDYDPGMILVAISGMARNYARLTQMFGFCSDLSDEQVADVFTSMIMTGIQPSGKRATK
jgi:TetR/AcrR family transcriptional regulator